MLTFGCLEVALLASDPNVWVMEGHQAAGTASSPRQVPSRPSGELELENKVQLAIEKGDSIGVDALKLDI